MTAGGATTSFRYAGAQLGGEFNLSPAANYSRQLRVYLYAGGGDTPLLWPEGFTQLSTTLTQTPTWFHADRLGSVAATTNTAGAVTAYAYGPCGEPQTWAGSRFRYTGQLALPEAQLYHYRARAYDPMLGRFLQTDPIGYGDGPNIYAYVHGDPVNGTDPSGLSGGYVDELVLSPATRGSGGDHISFGGVGSSAGSGIEGGDVISCLEQAELDRLAKLFAYPYVEELVVTAHKNTLGGARPPVPQSNFKIVHSTPPGAIKCSAYGMTFLAPPGFNLGKISAAGRAGGLSLGAMNGAVGQYGSFDFQRSRSGGSTTYYPAYQVASNVAVGAYLNGTGIPEILSNAIEDTFAFFKSSNAGNGDQTMGQEIGWDAASGAASLSCGGSCK